MLNKQAISQKVVQINAKFRLTLNWTLLRLYDFMTTAPIIVRLIMDLTNTRVVNMLVIKNTAEQTKADENVFMYLTFMHRQKCCFNWMDMCFSNEDQKMHEIFVCTVVKET